MRTLTNKNLTNHLVAESVVGGEPTIIIEYLTLANRPITRWTTLDGRHATGSDHEVIEWEFNVETQEEADQVQVIGWNLAAMSKEDKEVAEKLWKELEGERAHLDEKCIGVNVEREAEWCLEALSNVLNGKAKKIRIRTQSTRWLNGEIKERRSALWSKRERGSRSEAAAHTRAELQRLIWQSQSQMQNHYLLNLRGGEVWRVAMFANP